MGRFIDWTSQCLCCVIFVTAAKFLTFKVNQDHFMIFAYTKIKNFMKPNKRSVRVVHFFVHLGPDFSGGLVTQQLCKKSSEVHPRTGNEGPEGEHVDSSTLSLNRR